MLTSIVISLYILAVGLIINQLYKNNNSNNFLIIGLLISAIILHLIDLNKIISDNGIAFGIANSIFVTTWTIGLLTLIVFIKKDIRFLAAIIYILLILILLAIQFFPDTNTKIITIDFASHILISILSYSILTLVFVHSILLLMQDRHLHEKNINLFTQKFPSLQTMEELFFHMLYFGFVLLSLSLLSGFVFLEDIFAQHLAHKTVLSIIAWIIFAVLIVGHKTLGWRSKTAFIFYQIGFILLITSYFGSKFVLEKLL